MISVRKIPNKDEYVFVDTTSNKIIEDGSYAIKIMCRERDWQAKDLARVVRMAERTVFGWRNGQGVGKTGMYRMYKYFMDEPREPK